MVDMILNEGIGLDKLLKQAQVFVYDKVARDWMVDLVIEFPFIGFFWKIYRIQALPKRERALPKAH